MDDRLRASILGDLNDLPWSSLLEIAKEGIEKLTENELRAIVVCGATDVFWPGLITWHGVLAEEYRKRVEALP